MTDMSFRPGARLPLFAGSVAAALFLGHAAQAQQMDQTQQARQEAQADAADTPETVVVKGRAEGYKADEPALPKLTESVIDTPQMLNVTTRQVIEDRAATSLSDVFRNASGIAMGAGESSWQGTNLTLRGFNARNDLYLDGMRDFGSYTRDPFDLEEVEVLQGPSSILFGRGSTGGVVNQVSKTPELTPFGRGELTAGTDALFRGTADLNVPIASMPGTAVRLDAMAHTQEVTDRDDVRFRRYGVAPSIAFGLGTDNRLILSYLHQQEADIPDYGIPYFRGAPAPVNRRNFYGFPSDHLDTTADVGTVHYEHDFAPGITLRDQVRYAGYERSWRDMEPQVATTGVTAATPLSAIRVNRALQGGKSRETFLQNQMDLLATFHTGGIEHDLAAGWEIGPESSKPRYDNGLGVPGTSLLNPNEDQAFAGTEFTRVRVSTDAFTVGAYLIDTLKFSPHWELSGGVRWDHFWSHYVAQYYGNTAATLGQPTTRQDVRQIDEQPSYRGSLLYKPTASGTFYFDYSTSFNPSAEALSQIVAVRSFNVGNIGLPPEENETFEVGTKWNVIHNRLQLQAALFREEKDNARVPNPANSATNILAGDQQVDGGELEIAGQVTAAWSLIASYTYLDGKTIRTAPGGPLLNSPLFNAPANTVAIWTTYQLPFKLQLGGGVNYQSRRYVTLSALPYTSVPGYATADAMIKYQATSRVQLQVNVKNITDTNYIDQVHGYHAIPGEGRTALFSLVLTG